MSLRKTINKNRFEKSKKKPRNAKFFQNAKGFAKKGIFGRGTHLEDDEHKFYINVLDCLRKKFDDIEDKVNMANNVFETTTGREVYFASNQIVSKVMEALLGFIDAQQLERYFEAFGDNYRPICSDPFASHVLQKLVEIAFLRCVCKDSVHKRGETKDNESEPPIAKRSKISESLISEESYNIGTNFTEEHKSNCANFVLRTAKFMLNNLEDFAWDVYGSHVMRTCICCMSGVYTPKVAFERGGSNKKNFEVSTEWHDVCKEFVRRLEMWPQFGDLPYSDTPAAVLNVLCTALEAIDKKMLNHFAKKILVTSLAKNINEDEKSSTDVVLIKENREKEPILNDSTTLPNVFQCKSATFLLETLLTVARPKLFAMIYETLIENKLVVLAKGPSTQYVIKKMLFHIEDKELFENIFDQLRDHIEELLKIGNESIVTDISSACLRLQIKQGQFISALRSALHLTGEKENVKYFLLCLLKLKPFEITKEDTTSFLHIQGSLLVQHLLGFHKPIFAVNCILETPVDKLAEILKSCQGSYVCDAFLQSKFIGEKSREQFMKRLQGFYTDLAVSKFGSRVVEACFASAKLAGKESIVKELSHKANILKTSMFGEIINKNLRVQTYSLSAEQWKISLQKNESKAQELFKNIIK